MLDQVFEQGIWQTVLVGPLGVAKHAIETFLARCLNALHGILQRCPHIGRSLTHIPPVASLRDLEAMLLIPDLTDPLEEQQR